MGSSNPSSATGNSACFFSPKFIAIDPTNTYLLVTDNNCIRKIVIASLVTTVLTGICSTSGNVNGALNVATFSQPQGIGFDSSGNAYVVDQGNHMIRKISSGGTVSTVIGLSSSNSVTDGLNTVVTLFK